MTFNPRLSEGVRSHLTPQDNDPIKLATGAPLSFECDPECVYTCVKQTSEERVGEEKDGDRRWVSRFSHPPPSITEGETGANHTIGPVSVTLTHITKILCRGILPESFFGRVSLCRSALIMII